MIDLLAAWYWEWITGAESRTSLTVWDMFYLALYLGATAGGKDLTFYLLSATIR